MGLASSPPSSSSSSQSVTATTTATTTATAAAIPDDSEFSYYTHHLDREGEEREDQNQNNNHNHNHHHHHHHQYDYDYNHPNDNDNDTDDDTHLARRRHSNTPTNLSRDTERTHYTLQSDGQPITITTTAPTTAPTSAGQNRPDHGSSITAATAGPTTTTTTPSSGLDRDRSRSGEAANPANPANPGTTTTTTTPTTTPPTPTTSSMFSASAAAHSQHRQKSHTSLLIEYFEGGKKGGAAGDGGTGRPKIRVSPSRGGTLTATTTAAAAATAAATSAAPATAPAATQSQSQSQDSKRHTISALPSTTIYSKSSSSNRPLSAQTRPISSRQLQQQALQQHSQQLQQSQSQQPPQQRPTTTTTTTAPIKPPRYPLTRAQLREAESRSSSSATSSSEEIDPIAARQGKRAAVPSSVSYRPGSTSTGPGGIGSVSSAAATGPGGAYSNSQGKHPHPYGYVPSRQYSQAGPHSQYPPYNQKGGARGGKSFKYDTDYTDDDDDGVEAGRRESTDLDDARYSAPTPSDISSMPDDSLLNGENEEIVAHGKRREKMVEEDTGYGYFDEETDSGEGGHDRDDDDDDDYDDGSITVSGHDPSGRHDNAPYLLGQRHGLPSAAAAMKGKVRSHSQERIIARAAEKLNEERRRQRNAAHARKKGADPSPQVPPGGISQLSSVISSTYPNAQSMATSSAATTGSAAAAAAALSSHNPKLLETVEDVIRRLILPELAELKENQKVQANRGLFEQKIAQSDRLVGVSETVKDEALRKLLAKHKSAPDVICSTKVPPERQREVSGGSTVKPGDSNAGVTTQPAAAAAGGATAGAPATHASSHAQSPKTGMGYGGSMQIPKIVVPDDMSATSADMDDKDDHHHHYHQLGPSEKPRQRWRRRKNDHSGSKADREEEDDDEEDEERWDDDQRREQQQQQQQHRPTSRVQSRYSMRSVDSFDSTNNVGSDMPRRKSKSLREAANKGLVSSAVKSFNRTGPAGETIEEGDTKGLVPDGTRTELVFQRAGVPDMPFKSAIGSDVTRSSILSNRSEYEDDDEDEDEDDDDDEGEEERDSASERRREETRQGKRPAFETQQEQKQQPQQQQQSQQQSQQPLPSPSTERKNPSPSHPRSRSPIKRKPLPEARNISDQSDSTLARGQDSSRITATFSDPSTCHMPSATTSEVTSSLAAAGAHNRDSSVLGVGGGNGSGSGSGNGSGAGGSQDVHPPTTFTNLTTDESNLSSSNVHSGRSNDDDDDIDPLTGRHVEHLNAEHHVAPVFASGLGVESAVASLVSAGDNGHHTGAESGVSGASGASAATQPPTSMSSTEPPSSSSAVSKANKSKSGFNPVGLGSPLKEEMRASSTPSRGHSRDGETAQQQQQGQEQHEQHEEHDVKGKKAQSRPHSALSTSSSSAASSAAEDRGEETGIATEPDMGEFGTELQREADLDHHRMTTRRSRNLSIADSRTSSDAEYDDDTHHGDDSDMLGLRETNNSPYPFARPPKQFESPAQSISSLRGLAQTQKENFSPHHHNHHNQATVEDADEVETNPSIIHGPTSNPAASPGEFGSPREGLLPEPLAPGGGGSGSLRYNPDFMRSQEDYGHVVREETVPPPGDAGDAAGSTGGSGAGARGASDEKNGGATPAGVSAALATAAMAAGLDPERLAKGGIGFERSFLGSRDTEASFPDAYRDSRNFSSSSDSTNPLFDSAGKTFENIENKDIMALMQHLTVRDAQRNARDTEILFTLVRSAADMRNSFEEMKRFIAQQDEFIMETNDRQHQETRKAINGPRPPPVGFTRKPLNTLIQEEDENRGKKKNVFKRAMRGLNLSGKSSNELTKIEDMLYHLLVEVEQLRSAQNQQVGQPQQQQQQQQQLQLQLPPSDVPQMPSQPDPAHRLSLQEKRRSLPSPDTSAVVEGMIPIRLVSSNDRPAHLQNQRPRSYQGPQSSLTYEPGLMVDRGLESHQPHRVSPIHEADERSYITVDRDNGPLTSDEERYLDKTRKIDENSLILQNRAPTGLIPSPRVSQSNLNEAGQNNNGTSHTTQPQATAFSDFVKEEEEPQEKKKKGFFKKFKKGFARKERAQSGDGEPELDSEHNSPNMEPTRHADSPELGNSRPQDRPPSPLIPSEVSGLSQVSEPPRYRVHRDGTNLLHPKPRPYATEVYKNQLESEAQHFVVQSPRLDDWASISTASNRNPSGASQFNDRRKPSGPFSSPPTSDVTNMTSQSRRAQQRALRDKDDGPLVPERSHASNRDYPPYTMASRAAHPLQAQAHQAHAHAYHQPYSTSDSAARGSPVSTSAATASQRKLTGPRPLTSTSMRSNNHQPRRWTESPEPDAEEY